MLRRLRIAAIVFFAVLMAAFVVLWVHSYSCVVNIQEAIGSSRALHVQSLFGRLYFGTFLFDSQDDKEEYSLGILLHHKGEMEFELWRKGPLPPQFDLGLTSYQPGYMAVRFPHWFGALMAAALATGLALPWLSLRFSVRTMLIATTLVAVFLGLIIVSRRF